jgi:prepilin-type N-terminal cleavage/methylation domain-containing protein
MKKINNSLKKLDNKGFTLVELIIVIAIIAVLAAVLAPQYIKYVERSREAADANNCAEMLHAVQVAAADPDFTGDKGNIAFVVTTEGKVSITNGTTEKTFAKLVNDSMDLGNITMKSADGKALGTITAEVTTSSVKWTSASQTAVDKLNDGVKTAAAGGGN